ncbi:hypothetical protein ANRL2_03506 [Anaerolineae bacterium]|nr:hypothetical protein ANRL2_03506 [Anaerolineae bacterium]
MHPDKSRTFKVIGLGVLFILASIGVLSILIFMLTFRSGRGNQEVTLVKDTTDTPDRAAYTRLSLPRQIPGTRYSRCDVLFVDPKAKSRFETLGSYGSRSGEDYGSTVNVAIFDTETEECRLVFQRPMLLRDFERMHDGMDSLVTGLLYEAYINDTNHDGLLGTKDNLALFASDLDGRNLVQITPDSVALEEWKVLDRSRKLAISVKVCPNGSSSEVPRVRHQLLWYDLKGRTLSSSRALDELLEESKRIMAQ